MAVRSVILDDLFAAAALLTRLPVPHHRSRGARAAWAWPLAGAVVGLMGAAVVAAAGGLGLAPGAAAALALAAQALATGALHEDGLADSADGFWGGGTPERRLAIMADSRIGSYGALALVLMVLLRWQAVTALIEAGAAWAALAAVAAWSRWAMAAILWALPPAREGGLSRLVGRPSGGTLAAAAALAALVALPLGGALLAVGAATVAATLAWGALARSRIGGQTGDVCGAGQQLSEAAGLLALAALA